LNQTKKAALRPPFSSAAYIDGYKLQLQGNGNGRGGTCFGDSGGPVFLGKPSPI